MKGRQHRRTLTWTTDDAAHVLNLTTSRHHAVNKAGDIALTIESPAAHWQDVTSRKAQ